MELSYKIGISPEEEFLSKLSLLAKEKKVTPSELLKILLARETKGTSIKSAYLSKSNIIWLGLDEAEFKELENQWKSQKISVTDFFNKILKDGIENEQTK